MSIKFPYTQPDTRDSDIKAAADMITLPQLTQGPNLEAFERELAETMGARYAIVCNSGTAALHLAYIAAGIGPGNGLLTTTVTFLATANAARMCHGEVVFADVDSDTGNATPDTIRAAIARANCNIAAIAVTHMAGRPCDLEAIREVADQHNCLLIEDAAHAPLAAYVGKLDQVHTVGSGTHSFAVAMSFHAVKHAAMGEGGAVLTNNSAVAESARTFRNHGMIREESLWRNAPEPGAPWYYEMHDLGWNYRATEFECALGRTQLPRLRSSIASRQGVAKQYETLLGDIECLKTPEIPNLPYGHSWHLYPVAIDFDAIGRTRGDVMRRLLKAGVGTQVHYVPVHKQPYYANPDEAPYFPGAEAYYSRTLSLPMYSTLDKDDIQFIADALRSALGVD